MTDLTALDATRLSRLLATREIGAVELMTETLDRIERVNPQINAIVALRDREELLAEAAAADSGPRKGWLHGLPIAVKDLQAVKGIRSTWGSPLFADFVPPADDRVPALMRAAGAIFIGKTNTPEFGLGSHSYNPVYGVTANPYDLSRTAGGSSGGTAAALAARLMPVADGSDAMGSLRNPAAYCNVYGFRPSFGLVPGSAIGDTFLHQLATDGPMARTVEDIARMLEVQAVPDPRQPHSRLPEPYAADLDIDPKGLRLGWLGDWGGAWPMEPGILELCEAALMEFEAMGCIVEPVPPPFPAERLWDSWTTLRSWSVAGGKEALYADPAKRAQLKPALLREIERGLAMTAMEVHRASVIRSDWFAKAARLFERYDALVLPTAQVWPFPKDWTWPTEVAGRAMDTYHRWMEVVIPVSLAGLPSLNIPVGFGANGLPMGMQLAGPRGGDRAVLRLGQAWHRATDWPGRRPPAL